MSTDALKAALEDLADPIYCEGTHRLPERLAIALPDGDVGALDDPKFVEWLIAHAEDAPFGEGGKTKVDKQVRHAKRLRARGGATVAGFEPAAVLGEIEAALSPRTHLDAKLEDVIVYPEGGRFARHKDTPRSERLVGTLVVGLPIAHQGGAFEIADAGTARRLDWSDTPDTAVVRWAAVFSDVDHEVKPVTGGARVTLVYSLSRSDRPRVDAARDQRLAKLRAAAGALTTPRSGPLMIACTRQVITDGTQPQPLAALRGADREIAEVLVEAGFEVAVRACMVAAEDERQPFPETTQLWGITRLARALPQDLLDQLDDVVSFTDEATADEEDELGASKLGPYVLDTVELDRWVIRKRAAATIVHEGLLSETGYFGNEAYEGYLYTLAALEVTGSAKR